MGEDGAIDVLGGDSLGVVNLNQLFRGGCFEWSEHHLAGVVDNNVYPFAFAEYLADSVIDGLVAADVHFDGFETNCMSRGEATGFGCCERFVAVCVSHSGVHHVTRVS